MRRVALLVDDGQPSEGELAAALHLGHGAQPCRAQRLVLLGACFGAAVPVRLPDRDPSALAAPLAEEQSAEEQAAGVVAALLAAVGSGVTISDRSPAAACAARNAESALSFPCSMRIRNHETTRSVLSFVISHSALSVSLSAGTPQDSKNFSRLSSFHVFACRSSTALVRGPYLLLRGGEVLGGLADTAVSVTASWPPLLVVPPPGLPGASAQPRKRAGVLFGVQALLPQYCRSMAPARANSARCNVSCVGVVTQRGSLFDY